MKEELGIITSFSLGKEDHGIFTMYIYLDFGDGSMQGFGGYALDKPNPTRDSRIGTSYGMEFIMRVMDVAGAEDIKDLKGKYVIAVRNEDINPIIIGVKSVPPNTGKSFFPKQDLIDFL